jgi:hypothetical protein
MDLSTHVHAHAALLAAPVAAVLGMTLGCADTSPPPASQPAAAQPAEPKGDTRCEIVLGEEGCPRFPEQSASPHDDDWESAGSNQARCMRRAHDYVVWCKKSGPVVARFLRAGALAEETRAQFLTSCEIAMTSCPQHPEANHAIDAKGVFMDDWEGSSTDAARCAKRGEEVRQWCGLTNDLTARFLQRQALAGAAPPSPPAGAVAPLPPPAAPAPTQAPSALGPAEPVPPDDVLVGQTVLLVRGMGLQMDDAARARVAAWSTQFADDVERRLLEAGLRVVGDVKRQHDWVVRLEGAVSGHGGAFTFTRASLKVEADGVAIDVAALDPSEAEPRRAQPDRVATLLVNAIGHAPRLIAYVRQQREKAARGGRSGTPVGPAADPGTCRRQCAAGEERDVKGCCVGKR